MDDDLEDPPEILPRFLAKLDEGFDVVYGIRKQACIVRFSYRVLYRLFYPATLAVWVADIHIPTTPGDFCAMRKAVVETMNAMPESGNRVPARDARLVRIPPNGIGIRPR